jgi:hypothetical protein
MYTGKQSTNSSSPPAASWGVEEERWGVEGEWRERWRESGGRGGGRAEGERRERWRKSGEEWRERWRETDS